MSYPSFVNSCGTDSPPLAIRYNGSGAILTLTTTTCNSHILSSTYSAYTTACIPLYHSMYTSIPQHVYLCHYMHDELP